ncbi:hypothetical protein Hanom_Chr03g00275261 [Helianthus anomalus]
MSFKLKSIKKLIHVQKACRSFTEIFRSKLQIIKVRKAIKKVTTFLLSSRQRLRFRPTRRRPTTSHYFHLLQEGSPVIFINQRYVQKSGQPSREPFSSKDKEPDVGSTSTGSTSGITQEKSAAANHVKHNSLLRERKKEENRNKNINRLYTRDIRGVDERAADFISKVREDMKLQREQSIIEFQEMLARSV